MSKKFTLFLIDDEPENLKAVKGLIKKYYDVTTFSNPADVFKYEGSITPHIILSDYNMPGMMNGLEFFAKVPEKYPHAIKVMMSGVASDTEIAKIKNVVFRFIKRGDLINVTQTIDQTLADAVSEWERQEALRNGKPAKGPITVN